MKNVEDAYPLSPLQESLLHHVQAAPESGVGFEQKRFTLTGDLDVDAFQRAWQVLADRHPILRTAFFTDGLRRPLQVVRRRVELPVELHDWQSDEGAPGEEERRLDEFLAADRRRGFDPRKAPLMRGALMRCAGSRFHFVWSYHHLILDAWCRTLVLGEMFEVYDALVARREPPQSRPHPFRDYIQWLGEQDEDGGRRFWSEYLEGVVPTPLRWRGPESACGGERTYESVAADLDAETTGRLLERARTARITPGTLVYGAWALILARTSGRTDAVFGTGVSGRPAELSGMGEMLGMFVNNLPLRVEIPPQKPVGRWLLDLQETAARIRRYEHSAPETIHEASGLPWNQRLFESLVLYQNTPQMQDAERRMEARGLAVESYRFRLETNLPLTFTAATGERLVYWIHYDRDRFAAEAMERLAGRVADVLTAFASGLERPVESIVPDLGELEPAPDGSEATASGSQPAAPLGPVEEAVAELWLELTGEAPTRRGAELRSLGINSLLATRLVSRIRQSFGVEVSLRRVLASATLGELSDRIRRALDAGEESGRPPLAAAGGEGGAAPLSYAQERLWFAHRVQPDSFAFNIPRAVELRGRLRPWALRRALTDIVGRHAALRTVFEARDGEPYQRIEPPAPVALPEIDLGALPDSWRDEEARRQVASGSRQPFDLAAGPLVRVRLLRFGGEGESERNVLLFVVHHIVADAWSLGVLVEELGAAYAAYAADRAPELPPLPVQYADFALWQRRWLDQGGLDEQLGYWRRQLTGLRRLTLPTDRPRPERPTLEGRFLTFRLPPELSAAVRELSRESGTTLFMTLLAAFAALLGRWAEEEDVVVGTDVANRNLLETERLIGFFINHLVLRVDLTGDPGFRELLLRVRELTLTAYSHQDAPFDRVVKELQPARSLHRTPLFDVLFVVQNVPMTELELGDLEISPFDSGFEMSKFDLALFVTPRKEEILASWHYRSELFDRSTLEAAGRRLTDLLAAAVASPDERLSTLWRSLEADSGPSAAERESRDRQRRRLESIRRRRRRAAPVAGGSR